MAAVGALALAGAMVADIMEVTQDGDGEDTIQVGVTQDGDTRVGVIQVMGIQDMVITAVHMYHIAQVEEGVITLEDIVGLKLEDEVHMEQQVQEEDEAPMHLIIQEVLLQAIAVRDVVLLTLTIEQPQNIIQREEAVLA